MERATKCSLVFKFFVPTELQPKYNRQRGVNLKYLPLNLLFPFPKITRYIPLRDTETWMQKQAGKKTVSFQMLGALHEISHVHNV